MSAPVDKPLSGKVIITTGAGAGLGRAYSMAFLSMGGAVVANDIDADALARTSIDAAAGDALVAVPADVRDPMAAALLVNTALGRFGQLDAVVANAGILRSGSLLGLSDDDIAAVLDTHVTAAFRLLREAGSYWRGEFKAGRPREGSVVLTTSSAGLYGFRAESIYSAAKAALACLTMVAADEFARFGVTVNAVAPAARTRLTSWLGESTGPPGEDPLAPEHVAPVVAWLLGARELTGRVIEAGNNSVSMAQGWQPGPNFVLPPLATPGVIDEIMKTVVEHAPAARPIQRAQPPGEVAKVATADREDQSGS